MCEREYVGVIREENIQCWNNLVVPEPRVVYCVFAVIQVTTTDLVQTHYKLHCYNTVITLPKELLQSTNYK